jgi:hypothetical protein
MRSGPHSLEYLHAFSSGRHAPSTHASPALQSALVAHGQGPSVPPHASHVPATQALPAPQSAFVVHSFVSGTPPPSADGARQRPPRQTEPRGQDALSLHVATQPTTVQTSSDLQLALPVHALGVGGEMLRHPKPSHS